VSDEWEKSGVVGMMNEKTGFRRRIGGIEVTSFGSWAI
jgi:hypothetical protein